MSDLKLFKLTADQVTELPASSMALEKSPQSLIEKHLDTFLGITFLASEFSTGPKTGGRMDTLGIECDGATYHSARSARERDRQREAILRNHGWKIHRIWSTDWFVQPQGQLERVLQAIEDAISTSGQAAVAKKSEETAPLARLARAEPEPHQEAGTVSYQEAAYDLETDLDIHEVSTQWMMELVLYILGIEGPIHTNEVITRVREFWGVGRAGSRIQDKIRQAADRLASGNQIHRDGEFLSMPDQEIIVRDRSSARSCSLKKPEMLPPAEIREAIKLIIRSNHGVSEEEVAVGVGRMFGFKSTSKQLRTIVEKEVQALLSGGLVIEHGGLLKLKENA